MEPSNYDDILARLESVRSIFGVATAIRRSLYKIIRGDSADSTELIKYKTIDDNVFYYAETVFKETDDETVGRKAVHYNGEVFSFRTHYEMYNFIMTGSRAGHGWMEIGAKNQPFKPLSLAERDQRARDFLRGHYPDLNVISHAAIERDALRKVIKAIEQGERSLLIKGSAGDGKTTAMMQLACILRNKDWSVFITDKPRSIQCPDVRRFSKHSKIAMLVDNAHELEDAYKSILEPVVDPKPFMSGDILVVFSARTNEWYRTEKKIYGPYAAKLKTIEIGKVSQREANDLSRNINFFGAAASNVTGSDILNVIKDVDTSNLLPAMMVVTRGHGFRQIIKGMVADIKNTPEHGRLYYKATVAIAVFDYLTIISQAENSPLKYKNNFRCNAGILDEIIGATESINSDHVKDRLEEEAIINQSTGRISIRHPHISRCIYEIAFSYGDKKGLNSAFTEQSLLTEIVYSLSRTGHIGGNSPRRGSDYSRMIDAIRRIRPHVALSVCRNTASLNDIHFWSVWALLESHFGNIGDFESPAAGSARWILRQGIDRWAEKSGWLWERLLKIEIANGMLGNEKTPEPYTARWLWNKCQEMMANEHWGNHVRDAIGSKMALLEAKNVLDGDKSEEKIEGVRTLFRIWSGLSTSESRDTSKSSTNYEGINIGMLRRWGKFEAILGNTGEWDNPHLESARGLLRNVVNRNGNYARAFATLGLLEIESNSGVLGEPFDTPPEYSARWSFRKVYNIWAQGSRANFISIAAEQSNGDFAYKWLEAELSSNFSQKLDQDHEFSAAWLQQVIYDVEAAKSRIRQIDEECSGME